jgi:hypothetical protein
VKLSKDWRAQLADMARDEGLPNAPPPAEPEPPPPMGTKQRNGFLRRLAVVQKEWNTFAEAAAEHPELVPVVTDLQAALLRARARIAADQAIEPRRQDGGEQQPARRDRPSRARRDIET